MPWLPWSSLGWGQGRVAYPLSFLVLGSLAWVDRLQEGLVRSPH